jgi:hypothetical protein
MKEQFIHIDEDGDKLYYSDREMKIRHREDGPAVEWSDGYKAWWLNGKLHREDGPAIEHVNGDKSWWLNGKHHREDGPAVEGADGTKAWWLNGKLHREDGPAIEHVNGDKSWWLNGKYLTEEEFNARMNPVEITLDEIAEKFGVSVDKLKIKK